MKLTRTCCLHGGRPAWRLLSCLVLVGLACSTVVKADLRTSVRAQPPGGGRVLVLYTYYEAPKAADNLRFFVAKTILEPAQHRARRIAQLRNACTRIGGESDTSHGSQNSSSDACSVGTSTAASQDAMAENVDYVFVISGHECSVQLPEGDEFPHVRVLSFDNTAGHDFGAWAEALDYFNLRSPAHGRENIAVDDKPSGAWKEYGAFVFINSSCRGPFLPGYVSGTMHWATPFVSRLSEKVRLVGPSVHFIPSYSNEVAFCDPKRSSLWANISRMGAGPRLDGYMLVTDTVGLELLLRAGVFSRWEDKWAAVNSGEYGASRAVLEAGYAVASLNSEWADKDLSDVSIWPGPLGFNRTLQPAVTVNQVRALWRDKPPVIYAPDPMEVIFVKTLWGETGGGGADNDELPGLEYVDEELALVFARMVERVYSHTLCKHAACSADAA